MTPEQAQRKAEKRIAQIARLKASLTKPRSPNFNVPIATRADTDRRQAMSKTSI